MLKRTPARKKYTTAGCVVAANMSYKHRKGLEGVIPRQEQNRQYIYRGSPQTPVDFDMHTG